MKKALVIAVLLTFVGVLSFQTVQAIPNVHLDYTKTTITLNETMNFTAQASYPANIVWYLDDVKVHSEFSTVSSYTFVPKSLGIYFVKLSVDGFTNPPPIGAIKVTVTKPVSSASESPPFKFVTPWVWKTPPILTVESPTNGTYTGKVMLNFTVEAPNNWFNNQSERWNEFNLYNTAIEQKLKSITYVLDGTLTTTVPVDSNLFSPYKGSIELMNITEGAHNLVVYTNATGVYRSFRGYFAQTQINDSSKAVLDFDFIPAPTSSPINEPANQTVQLLNIAIILVIGIVVIGCMLAVIRRHRKTIRLCGRFQFSQELAY